MSTRWETMRLLAIPGLLCVGLVLGACSKRSGADPAGDPSERLQRNSERAIDRTDTYETEIRAGRRLGYLDQRIETPAGTETVGVRCSTCHDSMLPGPVRERPDQLDSFHDDMSLEHGDLGCSSCHARDDRDKLKLADGERIRFEDTIELCGQCHGPQLRDYRHGAHGGMNGHWDLSRGPRTRNHCVSCHDPHAPAYPEVEPAPPPRDRFLNKPPGSKSTSHSSGEGHE